jgi:hypothetical protein
MLSKNGSTIEILRPVLKVVVPSPTYEPASYWITLKLSKARVSNDSV